MQFSEYTIHPLTQKVPEIGPEDYAHLKASIERNGFNNEQFPIIQNAEGVMDGRSRLKVCCELGIEPQFKEYTGVLPVEQFIFMTNIRRNLSKLQRQQMIADFAPVIISQVKAQMKKRQGRKGQPKNVLQKSEERSKPRGPNAARQDYAKALGGSIDETNHVMEIHKKAPELLKEVATRGGLRNTVKEARKRKAAKTVAETPRLTRAEIRERHFARIDALPPLPVLTKEQVDPELAKNPLEFAAEYGHVPMRTKTEVMEDRDQQAFHEWRAAVVPLQKKLKALAKLRPFTTKQMEAWLKGPRYVQRRANIEEFFAALAAAHAAVADHAAWLAEHPTQASNGQRD